MHTPTQVEVSEGIYKPACYSPHDADDLCDPCYHLPLQQHREQLP